ncbi:MAG: hypothetical protein ACI9BD_000153 [Candidatus Marinamargulisbacteria bacterium]|jgi:hypothetical protein
MHKVIANPDVKGHVVLADKKSQNRPNPKRDLSFIFNFKHYTPSDRKGLFQYFTEMGPKIDAQVEGIYEGYSGHFKGILSQSEANVVSLASGEGQELPGIQAFFEKQGVRLNYIGIDTQETVIRDTNQQFSPFGNTHLFISGDAASLGTFADMELNSYFLGADPISASSEFADSKSASDLNDGYLDPLGADEVEQTRMLIGNTDMVVMRHPEMFGPHGDAFLKMLSVVAPGLLKKDGFVSISFYFKQEHDLFNKLYKADAFGLKSMFKYQARKVLSTGIEIRGQHLDHYQILLRKKG